MKFKNVVKTILTFLSKVRGGVLCFARNALWVARQSFRKLVSVQSGIAVPYEQTVFKILNISNLLIYFI